MSSPFVDSPEAPQQVEAEALTVVSQARSIVIKDQTSYDIACVFLTAKIKPMLRRIAETFDPMQQAAHRAWKEIIAQRKNIEDPLTRAESIIKQSIGVFEAEQERIRQENQRQLEEEQRRLEEEQRIQQAVEMEQDGAPEDVVEEMLAQPSVLPAPVAAPTFQKAAGVSTRKLWRAEVTSVKELCGAIWRGEAPENYVEPNMTALNALAQAQQRAMTLKGVKAVEKTSIAGRAK